MVIFSFILVAVLALVLIYRLIRKTARTPRRNSSQHHETAHYNSPSLHNTPDSHVIAFCTANNDSESAGCGGSSDGGGGGGD